MALWGISTTTETAANNFAIPKYLRNTDRNRQPWDCFADVRGWVKRNYKTTEHSGISTRYSDEILIPVAGLTTDGGAAGGSGFSPNLVTPAGLGAATPVAIFFEDPNKNSPISIGAGGTNFISTNTTAYVHLVYNEIVYATRNAQVVIRPYTRTGVATGSNIVAYASSVTRDVSLANWTNLGNGPVLFTNFNGQITNRVSFAFTSPSSGINTVLTLALGSGVVGVITDISGGSSVTTATFNENILYNVGGAGTWRSVSNDGLLTPVGIGTTALTVKA